MARTSETRQSSSGASACRHPGFTREQEHDLARRWRQHGDVAARDQLARSQLGHVVTIAHRYRRYGTASVEELIAEGNFGLVRALDKFDPDRGTRFVTYAVYWIRASISQYLRRSRSMVSAGVHSKVLSKIRRTRDQILRVNGAVANLDAQIAAQLDLSPLKLQGLLQRLDVRDVPWDHTTEDTPGAATAGTNEPHWVTGEETVVSAESREQLSSAVSLVVATLDDRERYIVERRLMAPAEEELSLAEIGRHFEISRERARQIEARAMRKVRAGLVRSPFGADCLFDRYAA
jgi:RNA polymerase sigma-32 factor